MFTAAAMRSSTETDSVKEDREKEGDRGGGGGSASSRGSEEADVVPQASTAEEVEEPLHPLVSTILNAQKFVSHGPPKDVPSTDYRYTREEMMRIGRSAEAQRRHPMLHIDFDGDDGKFSPFKWLEAIWEAEGLGGKAPNIEMKKSKKLQKFQDALNCGAVDENSGLSPQRRGFSSGCRAPVEEKERNIKDAGGKDKDNADRLGSNKARNWRTGSSGGASSSTATGVEGNKYSNTKTDFQLPFQKKDGERSAGGAKTVPWRTGEMGKASEKGTGKKYVKDDRFGMGNEKLPEWADGTTTMDDMIELKGFEEPVKKTRRGQRKKENGGGGDSTSRPTSRGNADDEQAQNKDKTIQKKKETTPESQDENKPDVSKISLSGERQSYSPEKSASDVLEEQKLLTQGIAKAQLPENDLELAALLGLLDGETIKQSALVEPTIDRVTPAEEAAPSGSRLSRFFRHHNNAASGATTLELAGLRASPPKQVQPQPPLMPVGGGGSEMSPPPSSDSPVLPVLAKIFSQQHTPASETVQQQGQDSASAPQPLIPPSRQLRGIMRLEDLERGLVTSGQGQPQAQSPQAQGQSGNISNLMQSFEENKMKQMQQQQQTTGRQSSSLATKGNPLQDPNQQAHFINQLYRISKMQENSETQENAVSSGGSALGMPSSSASQPQSAGLPASSSPSAMIPPQVQALLNASAAQAQPPNSIPALYHANMTPNNPALAHHIQAAAQQMIQQVALANPGVPVPQAVQDQINLLAMRQYIHLQQQQEALSQMQHRSQQQQQSEVPATSSASGPSPLPMPGHLTALLQGRHQNVPGAPIPSLLHGSILQRLAENPQLSEHMQAQAHQMLAQLQLAGQQQGQQSPHPLFQEQMNLQAVRGLIAAAHQQQQQQQENVEDSQSASAGPSGLPPQQMSSLLAAAAANASAAAAHPQGVAALQALHHGNFMQRLVENPALITNLVQANVHRMMAQAQLANHGQPIPQAMQEQINMIALRQKMELQQQVTAYVAMQSAHAQAQAQAQQQAQQQNAAKSASRPSMIPPSVQRMMRQTNGGAGPSPATTTTNAQGTNE